MPSVPQRLARTLTVALSTATVGTAALLGALTPTATTAHAAEPPAPVSTNLMADPGLVLDGDTFHAFTTGKLAPAHSSQQASTGWAPTANQHALFPAAPGERGTGNWAADESVWAPDAVEAAPGKWLLFYSAKVKGLVDGNQRCIGVATSDAPDGQFVPQDRPLSCPTGAVRADTGTPIAASDQPNTDGDGLIDPSPFQSADGRRFVLFKVQRPPTTSLLIVEVDRSWTRAIGPGLPEHPTQRSRVLRSREDGQIENPAMVQRDGTYVLFASKDNWGNCAYKTVSWRSTDPMSGFDDEQTLMTSDSTGLCGPGGADVTDTVATATSPALPDGQIFLHGWVCGPTHARPCTNQEWTEIEEARRNGEPDPIEVRRVMYNAALQWDGAVPTLGPFTGTPS
ncbi:family 43 glycosylhydrolase [Propionibacteriaceae bacterium Y1685]